MRTEGGREGGKEGGGHKLGLVPGGGGGSSWRVGRVLESWVSSCGVAGLVMALHVKGQVREGGREGGGLDGSNSFNVYNSHPFLPPFLPPQLAERGIYPDFRFYSVALEAFWRLPPLVTQVGREGGREGGRDGRIGSREAASKYIAYEFPPHH